MASSAAPASQSTMRRLSMSGDSQWITGGAGHGRRRSSSGYALSPTVSSFTALPSSPTSSVNDTTYASPPTAGTVKRQLNPASIFQRLGLSTAAGGITPSTPPGVLGQEREDSHLPTEAFDGLGLEDDGGVITPRPGSANVSSYMDASPSISSALSSRLSSRSGSIDAGLHSRQATGESTDSSKSTSSSLPSGLVAIDADIILPFANRPAEIKELLEEEARNQGLYDLLKETFTPRMSSPSPSSPTRPSLSISGPSEWTWQDVQNHLSTPRDVLCDQHFIDILKAHVYPRSQLLWERLRACLGVDVDDERGTDRYEELSSDIMHHEDPEGMSMRSVGFLPPSPRAVLRSHNQLQGQESMFGSNYSLRQPAPSLSLGGTSPGSAYSPSGVSGMSISPAGNPFMGSGGNAELPTAAAEHPNPFSPTRQSRSLHAPSPTKSGTSSPRLESGSRSPSRDLVNQTPAHSPAQPLPRNHRRTSSGSSGFRRSLAMSSINEDAPVTDFSVPPQEVEDHDIGPVSPMMTPSSSTGSDLGSLGLKSIDFATSGRSGAAPGKVVGLGDLLRLRGHPLDYNLPLSGSALTTSSSASSISSLTSPNIAPGHLPPPTPLSPSSSAMSPTSSSAANLDSIASAGMIRGDSQDSFKSPPARNRKMSYNSVFESEDGESVFGVTRSTGAGPGMRFSFSSVDPTSPQAPVRPQGSGFALAGLNLGGKAKSPATDAGSGQNTPKGGSDSGN